MVCPNCYGLAFLVDMIRFGKSLVRCALEILGGWASGWQAVDTFLVLPFFMEHELGRAFHRYLLRRQRLCWVKMARRSEVVWFGPFCGEVGYELSYWIPWIRKFCEDLHLPDSRIGIITRGGAHVWYPNHLHSVELFGLLSVDGFLELQSSEYPTLIRNPEKRLIRGLGISRRQIAHPREMHSAIAEFRGGACGIESLDTYFRITPLDRSVVFDRIRGLEGFEEVATPQVFGSVRLYTNSLLGSESNVVRAWQMTLGCARELTLVDIGPRAKLDDHTSVDSPRQGIETPLALGLLRNNLAMQTLLILKSKVLISTYGGSSYIGLLTGVPTVAIESGNTHQKTAHYKFEEHIRNTFGNRYLRLPLSDPDAESQLSNFLAQVP